MRNITRSSILVILLLCLRCGDSEKNTRPILTQGEMVKALTEIYISEQRINGLSLPRDSAEREFERFRHVIFDKIGVSDSVFKNSFDYYMDRPIEMAQIYTALVDSLSLMEQRIESAEKK